MQGKSDEKRALIFSNVFQRPVVLAEKNPSYEFFEISSLSECLKSVFLPTSNGGAVDCAQNYRQSSFTFIGFLVSKIQVFDE